MSTHERVTYIDECRPEIRAARGIEEPPPRDYEQEAADRGGMALVAMVVCILIGMAVGSLGAVTVMTMFDRHQTTCSS